MRGKKIRKIFFSFAAIFAMTLILLQLGFHYNKFIIVKGDSMYPTVKNNSLVFLSQTKIKDNDIIVFQFNDEILIKRVIYNGSQDLLRYSEEGRIGDDNYPVFFTAYDPKKYSDLVQAITKYSKMPPVHILNKNQIWVDGDNLGHTISSENIGPIEKSDVMGTLIFSIGPDGFKKY